MGILAGYHTLLTDPSKFVLGEEYELGGYLHDLDNGGVIAFTTSYVRNGAFGSNFALPQYNYNVGSSLQLRFASVNCGRVMYSIFYECWFWIHDWRGLLPKRPV